MTKRALLLTLAALSAAPGAAAASTVDGRPIDRAAIEAQAKRVSKAQEYRSLSATRISVFAEHVEREWVRGELALAGIVVPEELVAAAEQRQRKTQGRDLASDLRYEGFTEAVWREKVRANVERRVLFDHFFRSAPDDASYERVFLDWAARWRAKTSCARPYVTGSVCGNRPRPRDRCDTLGFVDACFEPRYGGYWSIFDDVTWITGTYNNSEAEDVLLPRLARELPAVSKQVGWDSDADFISLYAKHRRPLAAFARWLHRRALRRPARPVLLPPE